MHQNQSAEKVVQTFQLSWNPQDRGLANLPFLDGALLNYGNIGRYATTCYVGVVWIHLPARND